MQNTLAMCMDYETNDSIRKKFVYCSVRDKVKKNATPLYFFADKISVCEQSIFRLFNIGNFMGCRNTPATEFFGKQKSAGGFSRPKISINDLLLLVGTFETFYDECRVFMFQTPKFISAMV